MFVFPEEQVQKDLKGSVSLYSVVSTRENAERTGEAECRRLASRRCNFEIRKGFEVRGGANRY